MKLHYYPYTLQLKNVFTLARSSRSTTPIVLTEIHYKDLIGYGEASLPPYLGETQESVIQFLSKIDLNRFSSPLQIPEIMQYLDEIAPKNTAAKASIDIALHDLAGKINGLPCYKMWNLNPQNSPGTSFTIGIDSINLIKEKTIEAAKYPFIKVKLGRDTDKAIIKAVREVTDKPVCADVNQGWTDKHAALDMLHWCNEQNVVFVEQPMPVNQLDNTAWLTMHSPIPIFADESFQRLSDLDKIKDAFSGINIKLMKCSGLHEAREIIKQAKEMNLQVMLGCMTETSCAISAASQIASLTDFIDLDGNLLISNDCFTGSQIVNGKVIPTQLPGIGINKCC